MADASGEPPVQGLAMTGKCQARNTGSVMDPPAGTVACSTSEQTSPAPGAGSVSSTGRTRPSALKSSQKRWHLSHQPPRYQCVCASRSAQVVARASEPAAGSAGSASGWERRMPRKSSVCIGALVEPAAVGLPAASFRVTGLDVLAASEISTGASVRLVKVHSKMAAGSALSATFRGMNGFQAVSVAWTGTSGSVRVRVAVGYSPRKVASAKRETPCSWVCGSPKPLR